MNLYNETNQILKKYNLSANKNLGQNFLISDEIVNKIIESANITKEDLVIEIGPGLRNTNNSIITKCRKSYLY
jgi:16S rRNA (adenine1518-N6/adenine1519-N6)-dimethyltransferase